MKQYLKQYLLVISSIKILLFCFLEPEFGCHLPLATGHGKNERGCQQFAGFRYYYNKHYGMFTENYHSFGLFLEVSELLMLFMRFLKAPNVCYALLNF